MSIRRQDSIAGHSGPRRQLALAAALLLCASLIACTAASPPSAAPEAAEPVPTLSNGELEAGTYLSTTSFTVPFEITVPDGWSAQNGYLLVKELVEGMGVFVMFSHPAYAPADGCQWSGTLTEMGTSVDDVADAFAAIGSTNTTAPTEVTEGEFTGIEFDLAVDSGVDITQCDDTGHLCIHSESSTHCSRYYQSADQRETYRVLDLDGYLAVIAVGQWEEGVDPDLVAEARAVFDSIEFVSG